MTEAYDARGGPRGGVDRRTFLGATLGVAGAAQLAGLNALRAEPPGTADARAWADVTEQFLLPPDLVYMNNGTLGPSPRVVVDATAAAMRRLERNPAAEYYGEMIREAEAARGKAAVFLGCAPADLHVTNNTTDAMNLVAQGLGLGAGDRVLTTDHEHPGGACCWEFLAQVAGIAIDRVRLPVPPDSGEQLVALFERGLRQETRVISVSHVTYTTGLRLPVARLAELAAARGVVLVVDGAQAPGALQVNVRELGCHVYATSAHKWLLAPKGTGLLYIAPSARDRIRTVQLQRGPRVYTATTGTRNLPAVIGLGAAVDFLSALGASRVEARSMHLRQQICDALATVRALRPVSPAVGPLASPLVTVELPRGVSNAAVAKALLEKHDVVVKVVPPKILNGLRISAHVYNSEADVSRLADALRLEVPAG